MVLDQQRQPLRQAELPEPEPGPGQVALEVAACAVCRTDLHIADGELDKQGRIVIPPSLLGHGGLERDVVVAGVHDHVEIWNRAAWRTQLAELEGSAEDVAERLAAQRD